MKKNLSESIPLPNGISCTIDAHHIIFHKGAHKLSKTIDSPKVHFSLKDNNVVISAPEGSKKEYNIIKSYLAHIKNIFSGLDKEYIYNLESCNVHFPMTLKVEKDHLLINNFLGEKVPRKAKILPNVVVEVKGPKITVKSRDKESAGQTSANIEKATKVRNRDRRIFQDGIFLVSKEVAQ